MIGGTDEFSEHSACRVQHLLDTRGGKRKCCPKGERMWFFVRLIILSKVLASNQDFVLNQHVLSDWPFRGVGDDCQGCIRVDAERDRTIGFFVAVFDRKQQFSQALPSSASSSQRTSKQEITSSSGTGVEIVPEEGAEPVRKKRKKKNKKKKKKPSADQ